MFKFMFRNLRHLKSNRNLESKLNMKKEIYNLILTEDSILSEGA